MTAAGARQGESIVEWARGLDPERLAELVDDIAAGVTMTGARRVVLLAEVARRLRGDVVAVAEGYWHRHVRAGQVHDHPDRPGRGWSVTSHRMCELVYTHRHHPTTTRTPT